MSAARRRGHRLVVARGLLAVLVFLAVRVVGVEVLRQIVLGEACTA